MMLLQLTEDLKGTLILLFIVTVTILTIIDIFRSDFKGYNKYIWLGVVLITSLIGVILYFFIGTYQKIEKVQQ